MIEFKRMQLSQRAQYEAVLFANENRGCEYSFANKYLWGQQKAAFLHGCVVFFSHFYGRSVYPYPIGNGDKKAVIEAIIQDSRKRGIPCRITSMTQKDVQELEQFFPGRFCMKTDRDGADYVYAIDDLADLKGRKFQKKRNHVNKFRSQHPAFQVLELNACNMPLVQHMVNEWYRVRMKEDPDGDYLLENVAMARACQNYTALGLEGIALVDDGQILGVTMGSRLAEDTFDIHFEKALETVEGAYAAVNCEFARFLRMRHPEVQYLNREDDMGLEGLRKAKLSYNPHHMVCKYWAYLPEDLHEG